MMFADLIDLEDFADRLRELGLALPIGADETLVARELDDWLGDASQTALLAVEQMIVELEQQSRGLMLPSVEALVKSARERIH